MLLDVHTTLFMINIVDYTIHEEINTKNTRDNTCGGTLYFNAQYITSEAYVASHITQLDGKYCALHKVPIEGDPIHAILP